MKKMKGLGRVFSFTARQMLRQPGYRNLTLGVALLCLLVPAIVLGAMAVRYEPAEAPEPEYEGVWTPPVCRAENVIIQDKTAGEVVDWHFLQALHPAQWGQMTYNDDVLLPRTVVVTLEAAEGGYRAVVSLPEGSALTEEDAAAYESFLWEVFPQILQVKAGLTPDQVAALQAPIAVAPREEGDPFAGVRTLLGELLPYLGVMVIYFMVLFYGQGVANSVILEKSNKLMDFFLVSVEPVAMVLGKVLAIAATAIAQLAVWLAALAGGFALGGGLCRALAPEAEFGILVFFRSLSALEGMFSLPAVVLALAIVLGGFLIYCALAGMGGALASKQEDLGNANVAFSLVLVASFLVCLLGDTGGEGMISQAAWMNYVPFTAILVTPSRLLLGEASLAVGAVTLAIVALTAVALCALAGKVYTMMSLYKGSVPDVRKLLQMLKDS